MVSDSAVDDLDNLDSRKPPNPKQGIPNSPLPNIFGPLQAIVYVCVGGGGGRTT